MLRPCRGGAEDDGRSRIQELATVVFTNAKRVQADRIGMFDLLDQLSQTIRWIQRATVLVERRRKTVNTHLHRCTSEERPSNPNEGKALSSVSTIRSSAGHDVPTRLRGIR